MYVIGESRLQIALLELTQGDAPTICSYNIEYVLQLHYDHVLLTASAQFTFGTLIVCALCAQGAV
jgi:hypothetical protein